MQSSLHSKMFQIAFSDLIDNDNDNDNQRRTMNKLHKYLSFTTKKQTNPKSKPKLNNTQQLSISKYSPNNIQKSPLQSTLILNTPFTNEEWERLFSLNSLDTIDKERLLLSLKSGLANQIRGKVWMVISKSFSLSLQYKKNHYESLLQENVLEAETLINKDVPRTFLYSSIDTIIDIQHQSKKLFNVLKAYAVFDKEISYCQGMNSIAATLMQLIGTEAYCFWTFTAIMHENQWRQIYRNSTPKLFRMLQILKTKMKEAMGDLYQHFKDVNVEQYFDMIFSHFFITLFTYNCPIDLSFRIMDFFWNYEEKILFETIIKIVSMKKDKLIQMPFEELITYLKNDIVFDVVKEVGIDQLMANII